MNSEHWETLLELEVAGAMVVGWQLRLTQIQSRSLQTVFSFHHFLPR